MKGKKPTLDDLMAETANLPGIVPDAMFRRQILERFLARFSRLGTLNRPAQPENAKMVLQWQGLSELSDDHGCATTFEVLFNSPLGAVRGQKPTLEIVGEIQAELGTKVWERIEQHLNTLADEADENGHRRTFLVAAWAELFTEPFSEVWLAAMAQHAYFVLQDDYAFGYLTALLDQKQQNEMHFLRGQKSIASASAGGQARAQKSRPNTQAVLRAMERHLEGGKSVARAADLAHRNGHGTSAEANRKLWTRHRKK